MRTITLMLPGDDVVGVPGDVDSKSRMVIS